MSPPIARGRLDAGRGQRSSLEDQEQEGVQVGKLSVSQSFSYYQTRSRTKGSVGERRRPTSKNAYSPLSGLILTNKDSLPLCSKTFSSALSHMLMYLDMLTSTAFSIPSSPPTITSPPSSELISEIPIPSHSSSSIRFDTPYPPSSPPRPSESDNELPTLLSTLVPKLVPKLDRC